MVDFFIFPRKDWETFFYLPHYISLFVCLSVTEILARTFEVYKIRLYILLSSLKVNVRYQSQVKVIT